MQILVRMSVIPYLSAGSPRIYPIPSSQSSRGEEGDLSPGNTESAQSGNGRIMEAAGASSSRIADMDVPGQGQDVTE